MATKKSTKKSTEKSAGKSGRKIASKKGTTKKDSSKSTAKRSQAGRKAAQKFGMAAAENLVGNCIGLGTASFIVRTAIGSSAFDIDKTLEQMGLISQNLRDDFKQRVLNAVRARPCTINDGDVPNGASTTAREVRDAIQSRSGR